MMKKRRGQPKQRGMTLIEILVVVAILGLIASIVGIGVTGAFGDAKKDTAKTQISELSKALDLYKVKFHRYPTTAEGVQALASPPGGKTPIMDKVPKDPWDQDYIYVSPGQHNAGKFDLQSKGDDGVADTEDDITNW